MLTYGKASGGVVSLSDDLSLDRKIGEEFCTVNDK